MSRAGAVAVGRDGERNNLDLSHHNVFAAHHPGQLPVAAMDSVSPQATLCIRALTTPLRRIPPVFLVSAYYVRKWYLARRLRLYGIGKGGACPYPSAMLHILMSSIASHLQPPASRQTSSACA